MSEEQVLIAVSLALGGLVVKVGGVAIKAYRAWNEGRLAMRKQAASERDEEREDTIRIACRALDASDKARETIEAMLRGMYEDVQACREEGRVQHAQIIQLQDEVRGLKRDLRDAHLEIERLTKVVESQRETLLHDYVRKPESVRPADEHGNVYRLDNSNDKK